MSAPEASKGCAPDPQTSYRQVITVGDLKRHQSLAEDTADFLLAGNICVLVMIIGLIVLHFHLGW